MSNTFFSNRPYKVLNSIGAMTQPCLTPLWISNGSWLREAAIELHCSFRVSMERLDHDLQFGWATDFGRTLKRPSLLTRSNALVISMKAKYKGICCSLHCSCNCRREKIMYIVDRSARKPHRDSGIHTLRQLLETYQYDPLKYFADNAA